MTWKNRIKLFVGFVAVLTVVASLTVVFNQRQSQVPSNSASIEAKRYPVGIDYGGTVTTTEVENGERVAVGDTLFTLQSPSLQSDLAKGLFKPKTISYSVEGDGTITLTAAVAGTVSEISTEAGSFVQAGQVLATIDESGSLFVTAQYVLSARDYARIEEGAPVNILLPNQQVVSGSVSSIDVETAEGEAESTVLVTSNGLVDGAFNGLVKRGTPVSATLSLRDDGVFAGVQDGVQDFMRKIGV
ncbi:MAG: biotin attachment protein [Microbacteriaceae bacterium]|jgi:multidrug resistance efflux pump|nr:biotin attachment protein [Microbacteriaceae bacterium]